MSQGGTVTCFPHLEACLALLMSCRLVLKEEAIMSIPAGVSGPSKLLLVMVFIRAIESKLEHSSS